MSDAEPPQGPEWVSLDDGSSVADLEWWWAQQNGPRPSSEGVHLVSAELVSFAESHEEPPVALLGTGEETLLPGDGMLLMYGDGGAGKTTVTIDALFHLASGTEWLGLPVAEPVRLFVIENEGPRASFRQRLREKLATLPVPPGSAFILEEPWSRYTLKDDGMRAELAEALRETRSQVLAMGPLATLGTVGGGTADEIIVFEQLLTDLRERLERPLALWIVHHENKAGDVSGAWERVPDTMVHVQGLGNGNTQLVWRKARWSSTLHGTTMRLRWTEGRSYELVDETPRDYEAEILALYEDGNEWRTVKEVCEAGLMRESAAREALKSLVAKDQLEVARGGVAGKSNQARVYRLREATVLHLLGAADKVRRPEDDDLEW